MSRKSSSYIQQTSSSNYQKAQYGNIHQSSTQGNKYIQEHSVERLKSCIADLKKLATTKVRKSGNGASNSNLHSNANLNVINQAHQVHNQYESRYGSSNQGYESRGQSHGIGSAMKSSKSGYGQQRSSGYGQGSYNPTKYTSGSTKNINKYPSTRDVDSRGRPTTGSHNNSRMESTGNYSYEQKNKHQQKMTNVMKKYTGDNSSSTNLIDSQRERERGAVNNSLTQQRATTTKKTRPQSGKPATNSVVETNQVRGGSLKRDLYSNQNNFGLTGSSSKNKQKITSTTQSSKQIRPSSSDQSRVVQKRTQSQDPHHARDKYGNIVQYSNYVVDDQQEAIDRYGAKKNSTQNMTNTRPQSGYIQSQAQPRSQSTSYLQKQQHQYMSALQGEQMMREPQPRGSSVNDLNKRRPTPQDDQISQNASQYQRQFDKYQNYSKVLSDRYQQPVGNSRSNAIAQNTYNSTKQPQQKETRPSSREKERISSSLQKKTEKPLVSQKSSQMNIKTQGSGGVPAYNLNQASPQFTIVKQNSDVKNNILQEFNKSNMPTQKQQMLERYSHQGTSSTQIQGVKRSSRQGVEQFEDQNSVTQQYMNTEGSMRYGSNPHPAKKEQTHSIERSISQQSMMGAMEEENFKDGKSNVVQNLNVNMSPAGVVKQSIAQNFAIAGQKRPSKNMNIQNSYDGSSGAKMQQAQQMGGSRPPNVGKQQPQTIYSLQQAAGGYNSLSLANGGMGGNHTLNYNITSNGRTLMVTREDFNIEDIHCQMVFKIQREQQLLREIEGDQKDQIPSEDLSHLSHHTDGKPPTLVEIYEDGGEILCGDMCNKPAINWGKGRPVLLPPKSKKYDKLQQDYINQISPSQKTSKSQQQKTNYYGSQSGYYQRPSSNPRGVKR